MLNSHDFHDRQVIAAARELDALRQKRYKIKQLEQPYQRGWRRSYTLSERALDRQDRATLEAILEVIGSVVVHHSRNFQRRQGRARKLCEIEQPLRSISVHEWQRKNYPESWRRYFQYQLRLEWNHHWQPYWVFVQASLYQLKVGRNWIDQIQEIDPEIESRLGELDRWFELHQSWRRHGWLKGRRQSCRYYDGETKKQRLLKKEHRREIARACLIFPEVDPAASTRRIRTSPRPTSPHFSRRSPMQRQRAQTSSSAGSSPAAGTHFRLRSPTGRGTALRTPRVLVQIQPRSPNFGPEA